MDVMKQRKVSDPAEAAQPAGRAAFEEKLEAIGFAIHFKDPRDGRLINLLKGRDK